MNTMVADALVGRTVDRRYRVDSRLAAGGMATVYLATDLRLDRPVALKVMRPQFAEDPEFVSRFRTEARAAARLSHPHVVAVFDQGEADGLVFLAMEFVSGRTLREILQESGHLSPEQALAVLDQVLQALEAAHSAGFVHRDVKPENVIVTEAGTVKVTDFGLARALESPTPATQGMLIGTAAYLAPEQVTQGASDQRSDVYQAGVLLFELISGQPPHSGDTPWAVAYRHVNSDVPRLNDLRPDCPASLDQLVADATARDPADRIADVTQFLARSRGIAATLPPPQPFTRRTTVIVPDTTTRRLERNELPDEAAAAPPPPPATGDRKRWTIGTTVMVVAIVMTAALAWIIAVNPFDRTDVPVVAGKTEAKATSNLVELGFTVVIAERQFSETVPVGIVISSDPEGDSGARTGSEVSLVVSLGPERYEVPKVKGQSTTEAAATLAATNLAVAGEKQVYHDTVDIGLVVGTDPERGTEVKRDAPIELLVSKGPAPVDVPDLAGKSESAAKDALAQVGLKVATTTRESTTVARGIVIGSKPKPGATLLRGDTVTLIVSEGPPPVEVPNVVDQPRQEAVATLRAAGLKVTIDEGVVTPLDRVYSQDPPGGTSIPVGSTVTISIF